MIREKLHEAKKSLFSHMVVCHSQQKKRNRKALKNAIVFNTTDRLGDVPASRAWEEISAIVNQRRRWRHSNLFETVDTEPSRLYIRNPGTVVWLFIEREKMARVDISIHALRPPRATS